MTEHKEFIGVGSMLHTSLNPDRPADLSIKLCLNVRMHGTKENANTNFK